MILGRHVFQHNGRQYRAELRIVGFSIDHAAENPRWVVFDVRESRQWMLPGEGMVTETPADIQIRFASHLESVARAASAAGEVP